jgi:uncharacterized protein YdaU (DUF1376 family)
MSRPSFFAFYPADFANDIHVEAMSTLQVGAYVLLLCKAWQSDPPASLPNDDQILARLARVDAVIWQEIKAGVLVPFRLGADGKLHSKRLRQEHEAAQKRMRIAKENGRKGGRPKSSGATGCDDGKPSGLASGIPAGNPQPNQRGNPTQSSESPISVSLFPSGEGVGEEEDTPLPPAKPGGVAGGEPKAKKSRKRKAGSEPPAEHPFFAEFWKAYPRKEKRDDATRAFSAINPSPELFAEIMRAVEAQKLNGALVARVTGEGRSTIPHPTTWLNKRRWTDVVPAIGPRLHQPDAKPALVLPEGGIQEWARQKQAEIDAEQQRKAGGA